MRLVIVESPFAPQTALLKEVHCGEGAPACFDCALGAMRAWENEVVRAQESARNVAYARAALHDCLRRGEAPFASHLLYTQAGVLDDTVTDERTLGIEAGLAWKRVADVSVVYTDLGISEGMRLAIARALARGRPVEYRELADWKTP